MVDHGHQSSLMLGELGVPYGVSEKHNSLPTGLRSHGNAIQFQSQATPKLRQLRFCFDFGHGSLSAA